MHRPKAADLGVTLSEAAEALRLLVSGDAVTTYNQADSTNTMAAGSTVSRCDRGGVRSDRVDAVLRRVRGRVLPDTGRTRVGLGSVRTSDELLNRSAPLAAPARGRIPGQGCCRRSARTSIITARDPVPDSVDSCHGDLLRAAGTSSAQRTKAARTVSSSTSPSNRMADLAGGFQYDDLVVGCLPIAVDFGACSERRC
jgi:hypothetical protein